VRIDRSDPADRPGDDHMARHAPLSPDDPSAAGKDRSKTVTSDGPPDSSPAHPGSALRTERTAYRADVDAVYRQYAIDHGHARVEKLKNEPATPSMRRIEAEDPEPQMVGLDDRPKDKGRMVEAADLKKSEAPQASNDTTTATRDRSIPGYQSGEYDTVPRAPILVHDCELPEGYTSSPALKRDPYHPDSVAARSAGNQELYAATSRDRAAALGYTTRIPAQKAPFDSHGQEVFTNGKSYITPDVDRHNVTNGWKMFSRRGARIGTYDSELNYVKE
jgi:Novel toxin 21